MRGGAARWPESARWRDDPARLGADHPARHRYGGAAGAAGGDSVAAPAARPAPTSSPPWRSARRRRRPWPRLPLGAAAPATPGSSPACSSPCCSGSPRSGRGWWPWPAGPSATTGSPRPCSAACWWCFVADLLGLPFAAWRHAVVTRFGLTTSGWRGWAVDLLKSYAVGAVIGALGAARLLQRHPPRPGLVVGLRRARRGGAGGAAVLHPAGAGRTRLQPVHPDARLGRCVPS